MSRKPIFWALVIALNVVPLTAFGKSNHLPARSLASPQAAAPVTSTVSVAAAPAPSPATAVQAVAPRKYKYDDLTMEDMPTTFKKFSMDIKGSDPSNRAQIWGMVYSDCKQFFTVVNSSSDKTLRSKDYVGFEIKDPGHLGRDCVARHDASETCTDSTCSRLSFAENATLELGKFGDVKIGLIHVDPEDEHNRLVAEDVDPSNPLSHIGRATIDAARKAKELEARTKRNELLKKQVASCRDSADNLAIARSALTSLSANGGLKDGDLARINKDLDLAELKLLEKRAEKAPIEELASVREDLGAWAAAHTDQADKVATIYHKVALRYTAAKGAGPGSWDQVAATLTEARALDGLSDANQARLDNYLQFDVPIGKANSVADQGMTNNFLFWPTYQNLNWNLQNAAQYACNPQQGSMETCSTAMTAMRNAQQLPNRAMAVDNRMMQFQNQMYSAMNGQSQGQNPMFGFGGGGMQQQGGMPPQMNPGMSMVPQMNMGGQPGFGGQASFGASFGTGAPMGPPMTMGPQMSMMPPQMSPMGGGGGYWAGGSYGSPMNSGFGGGRTY